MDSNHYLFHFKWILSTFSNMYLSGNGIEPSSFNFQLIAFPLSYPLSIRFELILSWLWINCLFPLATIFGNSLMIKMLVCGTFDLSLILNFLIEDCLVVMTRICYILFTGSIPVLPVIGICLYVWYFGGVSIISSIDLLYFFLLLV